MGICRFHSDAARTIRTKAFSGVTSTYTYDPNHPYAVDTVTNVNGGTYSASYDADGNMTSRNGYPITWTVDNLPASIASAQGSSTFSYGPDHQRYYQSATFNGVTTDTTYIGGLFEVVTSSTGSTEYRHNISADGQIVAVHAIDANGSASTAYLHYDHLGSVNTITNDQGSVIQSMSFDAFGLRRDASNWDYDLSQNTIATLKNYTDRGYTNEEELDNLSLVDLNGRDYDPTIGRFISADPTIPAPLFTQAFNRYSYVYNSPLENVDPTGFGGGGDDNDVTYTCNYAAGNCSYASAGGAADCTNSICVLASIAVLPDNPSGQAPSGSETLPPCTSSAPAGTPCSIPLGKVEVKGQRQAPPPIPPSDLFIHGGQTGLFLFGSSSAYREYSRRFGGMWRSAINKKWYALDWGGNGATGARTYVLATAEQAKKLGRLGFALSVVIDVPAGAYDAFEGNYSGVAENGADLFFAGVMTFGGPPGVAIGVVYFVVEDTIGWGNVLNAYGQYQVSLPPDVNWVSSGGMPP